MISGNSSTRTIRASICLGFMILGSIPTLGATASAVTEPARYSSNVNGASANESPTAAQAEELSAALPMGFEPNVGQADPRARFVARTRGYEVFLTDSEAVLSLPISRPGGAARTPSSASKGAEFSVDREVTGIAAVRMRFEGARANARAVSENELPGTVNYLRGNDQEKWQRDIPTFARVRYENIYDGIDAVFYGSQQRLEYDVVVHPGADPSLVRIRFDGQESAEVTQDGNLVLKAGGGELRHLRPGVFQHSTTGKRPVSARYELDGDGSIRIDVGEYDRSQPLVIDPSIEWSSFIGGADSYDEATAIAVTSLGESVVCGVTNAIDFPSTPGAFSSTYLGGSEPEDRAIFVTKLAADGSGFVFSTYLDGSSQDLANDIGIAPDGSIVVVGLTLSVDFPVTPSAFDGTPSEGGPDGFITRLNAGGTSLIGSTFLGGQSYDIVEGVAIGTDTSIFVTGSTQSVDFPTTPGAFDQNLDVTNPFLDAFVTKLDPTCSTALISTFLGGEGDDQGLCIALSAGDMFVGGRTESVQFPATPGSFQPQLAGARDGFIARLDQTGSSLDFCTYFGGGSFDEICAIATASDGSCVAAGNTEGAVGFPDIPGSYVSPLATGYDCFALRIEPDGTSARYAALIGAAGLEYLYDMAIDQSGAVYLVGITRSIDLPLPPGGFDSQFSGDYDGFALKLSADGSSLVYGTYLGGNDWDWATGCAASSLGRLDVCGLTRSADMVASPNAAQATFQGQADGFALRLQADADGVDFSTFLSGTSSAFPSGADFASDMVLDSIGAIFLAGTTTIHSFPTTAGAFDTQRPTAINAPEDMFVSKFSPDGSVLLYSTFLGGSDADAFAAIDVALDGGVVISGSSMSSDFPTSPTAYNRFNSGRMDGVVARLDPSGANLVFGTYVGGVEDEYLVDAVIGPGESIAVVGATQSPDYPTSPGAFDTTFGGGVSSGDGFVTVFSSTGTAILASTFLGDTGQDSVQIVKNAGSDFILAGGTTSANFPTTPGAYDVTHAGGSSSTDVFVARIPSDCSALQFSTFLGGGTQDYPIDLDIGPLGELYVVGSTASPDFPTTPGALDRTFGTSTAAENRDGFVSALNSTGTGLLASTFIGDSGLDEALDVHVDAAGRVAVVGWTESQNFPVTADAFDSVVDSTPSPGANGDGFLVLLDGNLSNLVFGTFVGEDGPDRLTSVEGSPDGSIVVAGNSTSTAFLDGGFGRADIFNVMILRIRLARLSGVVTPAVYVGASGAWFLRNSNTPGSADVTFSYGPGGAFTPIVGDWDGDGDETAGIYDTATGAFFLRNTNGNGAADLVFTFGAGGAGMVALSGDWNGDGTDTIGLYVVATGVFFLRNSNSNGPADTVFTFGAGGAGIVPLVGDWNGDGADTIGLYIAGSGTFFLRNANAPGAADLAFSYGPAGAEPVSGDWNGDGIDTIGIYVPATGAWFLRNANSPGSADLVFSYGPAGATPIVGNWDGV